ncbi:CHC2 zinc finger domain-containing protein [Burkholderia cepacia]|uniref:CHC2 zinc finger domain-containing protein n=1 Tax=Burkholderia cepacia TaxID=292 RepID=UPI000B100390|nr:CHC2 zinc finger domain-containing protein [Burkholderia cepacia]
MSPTKPGSEIRRLIAQLADTIHIDDLAERLGIPVRRVGGRSYAQCIFHNDTNPSMALYPGTPRDKAHYHCFVCDAHGDIFELVKQSKGLDFVEAVRWLASSYGLASPALVSGASARKSPITRGRAIVEPTSADAGVLERVAGVYRQKDTKALEGWLKARALPKEIAAAAELGFAAPATLVNYVENSRSDFGAFRELLGQLQSAGLIRSERKKLDVVAAETYLNLGGQYRDFFNDSRVIFPIRDASGQMLGFAGRRLNESPAPKYLYSPNLPKSQVLYRANFALAKIKAHLADGAKPVVYVCEGLVDALRLESIGLSAVAVLGSRMSDAQARILIDFAGTLPDMAPLQVRFFLDQDGAGLKGATASIQTVLKLDKDVRLELGFVWPIDGQLAHSQSLPIKDPDDLLRMFDEPGPAIAYLNRSTHPVAVALLAERLRVPPVDILEDNRWETIPIGAKYRLAVLLESLAGGLVDRVLTTGTAQSGSYGKWHQDVWRFIQNPLPTRVGLPIQSAEEIVLQLNIARELAQAGANKGEVLSDIAAWRRVSLAATAFNEGLITRLQQVQFQPIEPFDAVVVSRGFGKDEERLKAMPCLEDLIVQQYLMNELLTERLDDGSDSKFSNHIPAVRYYRSIDHVRTTGEPGGTEHSETLSFAYQVDMDALEGRSPPGEGGMFRPYFECWRGFISSLLRQGRAMNHVHMVRLDLKRYYDRITRIVVKDILGSSIESAYKSLGDSREAFVPLFRPTGLQAERQHAAIDFLLDQSFGFYYYHPNTGHPIASDREKGIPQGPVLSAWLGNIILFKLDAVMRAKLQELNLDQVVRAGYARYVDDVVILAENQGILDVLRAAAEDVARTLQLELISKENFAPMSAEEFSQHLTAGRALPAYGPREEALLLESGDGDAGWGMWQTEGPRRQTSLELLRDSRLYAMPADTVLDQVYTALRADDLRPAELGKASRWLWYQAALSFKETQYSAQDVIACYWKLWGTVTSGAPFTLDVRVPWDDPAFHAIEGLENLFERANHAEFGLTPEESIERTRCIAGLARVARSLEFARMFEQTDREDAPPGWGHGTERLRRMFFQRVICMRWKAACLTDDAPVADSRNETAQILLHHLGDPLRASLRRSLITDAETWRTGTTGVAVTSSGQSEFNVLSDGFQWIHRAIAALASETDFLEADPLSGFDSDLERMERWLRDDRAAHFSVTHDRFLPLLRGLLPNDDDPFNTLGRQKQDGETTLLSLQTLAAIAPRQHLAKLLSRRGHLLQGGGEKLPLPPLPGVPARGLLLISHTERDGNWAKISTVWWVTPQRDDAETLLPSFRVASASGTVEEIALDWQQVQGVDGLQMYSAAWAADNSPAYALLQPPALSITARCLAWIADAYESIAKLNHIVGKDMSIDGAEFAPAWPYLVVNSRPESRDETSLKLTLLSPRYPRSSLDGLAFVRNGARGLQTYDVPELYGRHWRAGVLLSDLFGFRSDLDQYASLNPLALGHHDAADNLDPAAHLLRNVLRKLRGAYVNGRVLQSPPGRDYIPASIARSLDLLRKFPVDGEYHNAMAYVLSSEAETAGMRTRLATDVSLNYPGIVGAFFEQVAIRVVSRIQLGWLGQLSESNTTNTLSTERILPRTYWSLANRFSSLRSATEPIGEQERSLTVLVSGLRLAAISAWLRELTFSVEALPRKEEWPLPLDGEVAEVWQIEERGFLFDRPDGSVSVLTEFFQKKVAEGASERAFANVTPLGWLVLLAGRIGLINGLMKRPVMREWSIDQVDRTKALATSLSAVASTIVEDGDGVHPDWPFEFDRAAVLEQWAEFSFSSSAVIVGEFEANIGLNHTSRVVGQWKLNPADRSFTDSGGAKWGVAPWQILLGGGTKPERVTIGRQILGIWDETRDAEGSLLIVAARDTRLGKMLNEEAFARKDSQGDVASDTPGNPSETASGDVFETGIHITDKASEKSSQADNRQESRSSINELRSTDDALRGAPQISTPTGSSSLGRRNDWRTLQQNTWQLRRAKSPGHVRIALMQWELDETYHHPAIDADKWDKKWPPRRESVGGISKALLPFEASAIEYRRRQFLTEALTACESFNVDVLVLPEYSVRPDTVGWLKNQLQLRTGAPSILAGTYKLHGRSSDLNFEKVYREILGLAEYHKTFESSSVVTKGSTGGYISGEHSAVLTMLSPLELENGERVVCTFSRRKKYPSLAAAEVFNPPLEPLEPLFSSSGLLHELEHRSKGGLRSATSQSVSAAEILHYVGKLRHLECFAEFVCSELFLPMSLANHQTLAVELHKLARRFGARLDEEAAMMQVQYDIANVARFLGISDTTASMKRRSILLVPAMTTRSADYWIFGQAALLAGGATTVFCNAVDSHSVGGSCFIGRNSWNGGGHNVHRDTNITPYAGWSKGIYYNSRSDALGDSEQAMVIADVDPLFMQEGKPRPQALANPLQLVAYLPIVEVDENKSPKFGSDLHDRLASLVPSQIWSRIVEPTVPGIRELKECISTQLAAKDKSTDPKKSLAVPFNERFSHWENYWNTNVFVGMPPALVDWLWVESTPPTQGTRGAEIFVPGYSDDDLSPMRTDHSIR